MKKTNEQGQALIELIVFLPLMITLYSVIAGFASSINGSINQQKVSRAYFYYRIQNNSTIPVPKTGDYKTWKQFGMFYIGWKERFVGEGSPEMPCYKINIPFKENPADKCEESYDKTSTLWVRVGTAYGVCGATYSTVDGQVFALPDGAIGDFSTLIDKSSCIITQ